MKEKILISMEELVPIIKEQLSLGNSVRFFPRGTSMLPMLRQNRDSVLLSPIPDQLKKYDLVLYQRKNGKYVLHRIVDAGDTYVCLGDNQYDLERGLHRQQMIGIVTKFYRDEKVHSVDEFLYRIYVVVWFYLRRVKRLGRRCIRRIKRMIKH